MSWWRKPGVNACHIVVSLLGMIGFNNINLTSLFPASFVAFFLPQTNSEEIVHSFWINGGENIHQNKISDLVHKILDSLEKGMKMMRTPYFVPATEEDILFVKLKKYSISANSQWNTHIKGTIFEILQRWTPGFLFQSCSHFQVDWGENRNENSPTCNMSPQGSRLKETVPVMPGVMAKCPLVLGILEITLGSQIKRSKTQTPL